MSVLDEPGSDLGSGLAQAHLSDECSDDSCIVCDCLGNTKEMDQNNFDLDVDNFQLMKTPGKGAKKRDRSALDVSPTANETQRKHGRTSDE